MEIKALVNRFMGANYLSGDPFDPLGDYPLETGFDGGTQAAVG
jgi:hypothetical protein